MDNLQILLDHYQSNIDATKEHLKQLGGDSSELKDRLNAYVSGYLALSKLKMLNHIDKSKGQYSSIVTYKKAYEKVLGSQLI